MDIVRTAWLHSKTNRIDQFYLQIYYSCYNKSYTKWIDFSNIKLDTAEQELRPSKYCV